MREFKEAFGFFNSINSRDTELSVGEIHDVMARFEPHREIDAKVGLRFCICAALMAGTPLPSP